MKTDVVIIGAGPGGGMAACRLAQTGLKVLILEKASLPRHKPCGGGIPASAKKIIDWDITALVEREIFGVKNLYNYKLPKLSLIQNAPISMVNRSRFDHHLIERSLSLGKGMVELRDGFQVTHVEETAQSVLIKGKNNEKIQADFLIAADGVFGKTAQYLGLNPGVARCEAIDAEVEVTPEVYEAEKDYATFNFFCLAKGYGWIFPKDGILSCGVGAFGGNKNLAKEMSDFLAKSFPPGSIQKVKRFGYQIPLYFGDREIATRRVCLVGDAASLVDPIMGEGIRFALKSGVIAAEVIAGLVQAETVQTDYQIPAWGEADCQIYQTLVHQTIGKDFNALRCIAGQLFFEAPEFFYQKFMLEGQSYTHLSHQVVKQLSIASKV